MNVADTLVGSVLISVKILPGHIIVAVQWDSNFHLMGDLVKVRCYGSPRERERKGRGKGEETFSYMSQLCYAAAKKAIPW